MSTQLVCQEALSGELMSEDEYQKHIIARCEADIHQQKLRMQESALEQAQWDAKIKHLTDVLAAGRFHL